MQCNNSYARYYDVVLVRNATHLEEYNTCENYGDHCMFRRREPTMLIFAIYAFVVPSLALFGLCANFINAIVFMRPKMTPSAFTYLAALSWLDCISCLLITWTAFSRSIFFYHNLWLRFDLQWQTPLFGMTTGAANLILACVSLDRLVYLWRGIPNGTPRLCRRRVARRMIGVVLCISCIVNLPYFFVFIVHDDGTFETTNFYYSNWYKIQNWFTFILLAILPAVFLFIGNAAILIAFRRWTKQSKKFQTKCDTNAKTTQKRYHHQMKLTITILIVITLYILGELPAHLTSRKSALNLIYSGDVSKVDFQVMERLEVICITLNAVQLSMNIMIYALVNPSFMPEFFLCLRGASDACFRFFLLTALANLFKRNCCRRKTATEPSVTHDDSPSDSWSAGEMPKVEHLKTKMITMNTTKMYNWKRSNSLGNFTFDNRALERECNNLNWQIAKRHSVPIYSKG